MIPLNAVRLAVRLPMMRKGYTHVANRIIDEAFSKLEAKTLMRKATTMPTNPKRNKLAQVSPASLACVVARSSSLRRDIVIVTPMDAQSPHIVAYRIIAAVHVAESANGTHLT